MKVSELIAELQQLPQDLTVLLSTDAEGNEKNELSDVSESWARNFPRYGWETYADEDIEEERRQEEEWEGYGLPEIDEDDETKEVRVVVLWPI